MKLVLIGIGLFFLSGCSTSEVYVIPPSGTGNISVTVNQDRKGWDSILPLDGVQANVPLNGGTVSNPTNAPTIKKTGKEYTLLDEWHKPDDK